MGVRVHGCVLDNLSVCPVACVVCVRVHFFACYVFERDRACVGVMLVLRALLCACVWWGVGGNVLRCYCLLCGMVWVWRLVARLCGWLVGLFGWLVGWLVG